jgi:Bax protein
MEIDWRNRKFWLPALAGGITAAVLVAFAFWPQPKAAKTETEIAALPPLKPTDIHAGLDYSLNAVADTKLAPNLLIGSLEADLRRIRDTEEKKQTFFRIMLPIIAGENDRIRAERSRIGEQGDAGLGDLYAKYEVKPGDRAALLARCDIVPASLALAQAAVESGWGVSRFARHGNNFFGMRTYDKSQPGMAPKEATGFKVLSFKSIAAGVRAYMHNLNTNSAYAIFRRERAQARKQNAQPSGAHLVDFLSAYSEISHKYAERLRAVISGDRLHRFEGVRLKGG